MAHRNTLVQAARAREIHPSWAFAVTRQESAFMADARSHVGATGLMQLMPATAKETAKRFNIPLASPQQVLNPTTNIQLGTAYLSQIYGQFNGNRVLASAAYNAGPGRAPVAAQRRAPVVRCVGTFRSTRPASTCRTC